MITGDLVKKFPVPLFLSRLPLSTSTPQLSVNRQENTLVDMLQCFHSSMEQQLSSVCTSLTSINEHMDSLEGRQKSLEEEVRGLTAHYQAHPYLHLNQVQESVVESLRLHYRYFVEL